MLYFPSNLKYLSLKCIAHSIYLPFGCSVPPRSRTHAVFIPICLFFRFVQSHPNRTQRLNFAVALNSATWLKWSTHNACTLCASARAHICRFYFCNDDDVAYGFVLFFFLLRLLHERNEHSINADSHGVYYRFLLIQALIINVEKNKRWPTWYKQLCP